MNLSNTILIAIFSSTIVIIILMAWKINDDCQKRAARRERRKEARNGRYTTGAGASVRNAIGPDSNWGGTDIPNWPDLRKDE